MFRLDRERGQKFGAGQSIDILLGQRTEKVEQFGHDSLTVFGIGTELREAEWRGVVRQLLAQGLLAVEGELRHARAHRGERRRAARRAQVMLRRDPERQARRSRPRRKAAAAELPAEAAPVFERLRAWRGADGEGAGRARPT